MKKEEEEEWSKEEEEWSREEEKKQEIVGVHGI